MDTGNVRGGSLYMRLVKRLPIKAVHIKSVINIMFEELWSEIKEKREIIIPNFGRLKMITIAPSAIKSVWGDEPYIREKRNKLLFILNSDLKEYLCLKLDLDKTFDRSIKELFPQKRPKTEKI